MACSRSQNPGVAELGGNLGKVSRMAQFPEHSPWSRINGRPGGGAVRSLHSQVSLMPGSLSLHETSTTFLRWT